VAKSKSATKSSSSTSAVEKSQANQLVQQFRAVRSEIRKVTWPSREETRALTTAVAIGTVVMAFFLYLVDALFQAVVGGIVGLNIAWIIGGIIIVALIGLAFLANEREA
jgi:preprotein translocase subunit SecE